MNVAVIGAGKLGKIHARIYNELPEAQLKSICDINPESVKGLDFLKDIPLCKDYKDILKENIDAVSIATPTSSHFEIARFFLENNISCLVEKPITQDVKSAKLLLNLAKRRKVFLMVGMIERFNTAYQKIKNIIKDPKFIECHRLSPYPGRSLDISVVLDLMIHDLDIILDLVQDKIKKTEAVGIKVLSNSPDIANVRIRFKNSCIANITTSRVSDEKIRKIRVFFPSSYISLDYANQEAKIYQKKAQGIEKTILSLPKDEPLKKEIEYFLKMTQQKQFDYSIAEKSIQALDLSLKIEKLVESSSA